jgi:hypothetical protein
MLFTNKLDFTFENLIPPLICLILGGALIVGSAPTQLQRRLREIRRNTKPRDYQIRSEHSKEITNFWKLEWIHQPSSDDRGWVYAAPGPNHWNKTYRYRPDESGVLDEHPTKIGTPKPAEISTYGLISMLLILNSIPFIILFISNGSTLEYLEWKQLNNDDLKATKFKFTILKYGQIFLPVVISFIWLLVSLIKSRKVSDTLETPTSLVRSMAVGSVELVGQVRQWVTKPPTVYVGRDKSRAVQDLISWKWTYEILVETKHVVTDKNGRERIEKRRQWHQVDRDSGNHPYVLHDGTGGVLIQPNTFEDQNLGQYITKWECPHNVHDFDLFREILYASWNNGKILRHKWILHGLTIGDPCYLIGFAEPRDNDEEFVSDVQNRLLEVTGKDGTTANSRLERGSEIAVLGNSRSNFEYLLIPGMNLVIISSLVMYFIILNVL